MGLINQNEGSLGYETKDAEQYAAWGVDYLKYDNCNNDNIPDLERYTAMRKALNATGTRQTRKAGCKCNVLY